MNDWHVDFALTRGLVADRLRSAERARQARAEAERRSPLRLQVRLDLQVTIGRGGETASEPAA